MNRGHKGESDQAARAIEAFLRRVRHAGRKDPQIHEIVRELRSHLDTIWDQSHSLADLQAAIVDLGEPWKLAGDATAFAAAWRTVWILLVFWPLAIWRLFRSPVIPRPLAGILAGLVILSALLCFFTTLGIQIGASVGPVQTTTTQVQVGAAGAASTPARTSQSSTVITYHPGPSSAPTPNWPVAIGLFAVCLTIGPDLFGLPILGSAILALYLWKKSTQKPA